MKTTLNLNDALIKQAKAEAAAKGRTLTSLVEEGLKIVMKRQSKRASAYRLKLISVRGGPRIGVNIADRNALYNRMESLA